MSVRLGFGWPPAVMLQDEAAYYLGVSDKTLDALEKRGALVPRRVGRRRGYLRDDLDAYIRRLPDWDGPGFRRDDDPEG